MSVNKTKLEWFSASAVTVSMIIVGLVMISLVRAGNLDRLPWAPLGLAIAVLGVLGVFVEGIARAKWWSDQTQARPRH
jgi:ABC-type antimicrobial peptide transport system permease subunit